MRISRIPFLITSSIFLGIFPLFADGFRWDIEPYAGFRSGTVSEYVFSAAAGKTSAAAPDGYMQISRVDWSFSPVWVAGLRTSVEIKIVFLRFSIEGGLPLECGKMQDYDWLGYGGDMTHYSEHDNYLEHHLAVSLEGGWRFSFLNDRLTLTPLIGACYASTAFESRDGYTQYVQNSLLEQWSEDIPKEEFSGKAVSYRQQILAVSVALEAAWKFTPGFTVRTCAGLQPVVFVNGYDTHHQRGIKFLDWNMGGAGVFTFTASIAGECRMSERCVLVIQGEMGIQPVVSGKTYTAYEGSDAYSESKDSLGGNSCKHFGITAGVRFSIF